MTDTAYDLDVDREALAVKEAHARAMSDLDYLTDPFGCEARHLADARRELGLEAAAEFANEWRQPEMTRAFDDPPEDVEDFPPAEFGEPVG